MSLRALLSALPWPRLRQHGARYLWLGLFMGAAIFASLKTGEHYPFSHFPMYGNPNPKPVDYYFLTDATGQPLPVVDLTGDTAPKLKKRLNTELNEWGFANDTRIKSEIPPRSQGPPHQGSPRQLCRPVQAPRHPASRPRPALAGRNPHRFGRLPRNFCDGGGKLT